MQLRYRIDGLLQETPPPPKQLHAALVSRIKIMADMNIAERYMPQDGHIQINHRGVRVDIRVGTLADDLRGRAWCCGCWKRTRRC